MAKRLSTKLPLGPQPPSRCWGYARCSTAEQSREGTSLAEQHRRIRGRAVELGVEFEHLFVEDSVSGGVALAILPQGKRLMAAVRPGDTVIASKLDRMFRSAVGALTVIEDFRRRGVTLLLLDIGDCSGNGVAKIVIAILSAVAEFERERIGERIRDSKVQLRLEAKQQGGTRPFGWQLGSPNGKGAAPVLVRDEAEQAAIAQMVRLRNDDGWTLARIRDAMAEQGFPLSIQTVDNIAKRVALAGPAA
jgi:DNA invertase Pin-like site-specific DNA recombinase